LLDVFVIANLITKRLKQLRSIASIMKASIGSHIPKSTPI
jgi:hypothetical protein